MIITFEHETEWIWLVHADHSHTPVIKGCAHLRNQVIETFLLCILLQLGVTDCKVECSDVPWNSKPKYTNNKHVVFV